jgi:mannosyltransferase OCH1-like enzyme
VNTVIPKVIHYCWFGNAKMGRLAQDCIASWRKVLPNYDIIEWNEDNFDVSVNRYCREAYESRKWAFVSDYVRLYVLYKYGGIYMDTDVEVLKPLDQFLKHGAFSGFEDYEHILTGIIGAQKGSRWIEDQLNHYDNRAFILPNGKLDMTTNVTTITEISKKLHGFVPNGEYQVLAYDTHIYPSEWFCPLSYADGTLRVTKNTFTIHYFDGSWQTNYQKFKLKDRRWILNNLGETALDTVVKIKRLLNRV